MNQIDILLSTYNGERFLRQQLDSILEQTFKDVQILVRDDGSKDQTMDILKEYQERYPEQIEILPTDRNRGSMRSFECLMKESKAPYCMFADQDDVWLPKKIEHAFECIQKEEKELGAQVPIMAYSDLQVVNKDLELLNPSFFAYSKIAPQYLQNLEQLAVNNCITGCTMIFNAAARDCSLPIGEHALMHDVWIGLSVLAKGGKMIQLPYADILYRQHGKNVLGATAIKYNAKYFTQKLSHLKKLIQAQKASYAQIKDLYPMSWSKFLYNRIKYLIKR